MKKLSLLLIILFSFISANSQWKTFENFNDSAIVLKRFHDTLLVGTKNGILKIDKNLDIREFGNQSNLKNTNAIKINKDAIYISSERSKGSNILFSRNSILDAWDSIYYTNKFNDFYINDSIVLISEDYRMYAKNLISKKYLFDYLSVISICCFYGAIDFQEPNYYLFFSNGNFRVVDLINKNIDIKGVIPNVKNYTIIKESKIINNNLYSLFSPSFGTQYILKYNIKDSAAFKDSISFNIKAEKFDVFNNKIYVGGDKGQIVTLDTNLNQLNEQNNLEIEEKINDIQAFNKYLFAIINSKLYYKELSSSQTALPELANKIKITLISGNTVKLDKLNYSSKYNIKLFGIDGKLYLTKEVEMNNTYQFNIDFLNSGVYILNINDGKTTSSSKILKK